MSSATSDVTYTSVYTDSEPGRAFWGADYEEISEGGIPRVIVLGYDGLPLQPVAPPSPDYILGPENLQILPVPQDEDEREPMFIQAHDPDYVPEPIYPEYIPLEDDHEFPAEEQPLPPVDSPTAESPGYITESDPEEDPEGYEDDETEDGPVDYPMDGGDDGDDDDGDSSRDDARDEDEDEEDEEDEEEEEHLAPADSTTVIPADEPVSPPEGTEPIIPPPSTDITIGARITIRPQTSISLPPEAEVERLLAMTTPSPSPPISLSPPSAGERLARCTAPPAHSPPLPPSSGDDIPESEQPPRKRLHLSTICSRYEIGESSTARPVRGQGIDYGFVSTVDAEERRQGIRDVGYGIRDTWVDPAEAVPEIAPMTVGEVNTRVVELAELHERDTQDLYALLEDAQDGRSRISQRVDMNSQRVDLLMGDRMTLQETVWMVEEEAYASQRHTDSQLQSTLIQTQHQVHETRFHMQQTELAALRETDRRRQDQMVETLRVIRDMRREMSDMQAELLALREQQRRARQSGPEARIPDHQEASGDIDSCCLRLGGMVSRTLGPEGICQDLGSTQEKMRAKYCPQSEIKKWKSRSTGNTNVANTQKGNGATPKGNGCFECGAPGHFKRDCPKLKNKNGGNGNAQGWVYAVGNAEKRGNAPGKP
ncbi:putative reverse transcriptase domain-containing protein [Tanacetum coccineum]